MWCLGKNCGQSIKEEFYIFEGSRPFPELLNSYSYSCVMQEREELCIVYTELNANEK